MSKRYDEYINKVTNKMNNNFLTEVIPMVPDVDQKLEREIRDRAIIELVKNYRQPEMADAILPIYI